MGIVFPPGVVFLYTSLAILIVFEVIVDFSRMKRSDRKRFLISRIVSRGVFVLVSIPSFLYLNLMLSFYPWKRLAEFDIVHPLPFTYVEYIKALGPMLPLGIIGLLIAIARKERAMRASIVWVITWILLLIVFRFIPQQSPLRFSEMLPHLPLGVLTAYLFYILMSRFRSGKNFLDPLLAGHVHKSVSVLKDYVSGGSDLELGKRSSKILARAAAHENGLSVSIQFVIRNLSFVIPIFLVALGLFHMYSSYLWQKDFVDHKMRAAWPLVPYGTYVMYPLKDFLTAIRFIQDSTSRDTVVLSEVTAGNYIPVYSGNTVYIGHDNAVNHEVKKEAVAAFFRGSITPTDAAVWMERERLDVVFFGPQEQEEAGLADLSQRYSFLNEVYKNDYVRIYRR
jgi:hypothetical protein